MDNTCRFCGNEVEYPHVCKTCNIYLEDRMAFSGYHFTFMQDVIRDRRFKTLPYPTKEERCENCTFLLKVTDTHYDHKTREKCKNLEDHEHDACWLLPVGYSYDTRSVMFWWVKPTARCKRFKKRKGEVKTQVVMIVL